MACILAAGIAAPVGWAEAREDPAIVERRLEALKAGNNPGQRAEAAAELGRLGPRAVVAVPALLQATGEPDSLPLRAEAIKALGAIAPRDPVVLNRLADLLADRAERGEISACAQRTLVSIGLPAVPVLIEKLDVQWDPSGEDEMLGTWGMAGPALGRIGSAAWPALRRAFEDPRKRMGAAEAVRVMGVEVADDAVPMLLEHIADPDPHVRCSIYSALEAMGPRATSAVPALIAAMDDPAGVCATRAVRALGAIGPSARAALPALEIHSEKAPSPLLDATIRQIKDE